MTKKPAPIDPLYDFDNQSIEIDPVERVRVCQSMENKPLLEYRFPDVKTLYDVLPKGLELSNNSACLGKVKFDFHSNSFLKFNFKIYIRCCKRAGKATGSYSWIRYSDVIEQVRFIGSGLLHRGIQSSNLTTIGIYSSNRIEVFFFTF